MPIQTVQLEGLCPENRLGLLDHFTARRKPAQPPHLFGGQLKRGAFVGTTPHSPAPVRSLLSITTQEDGYEHEPANRGLSRDQPSPEYPVAVRNNLVVSMTRLRSLLLVLSLIAPFLVVASMIVSA